ncbi:MAG TPA: hypothetical protein VNO70_13045 [Blastocatellia bacterium]|nr:hypothetical protein [Blastocatellia bacterium]
MSTAVEETLESFDHLSEADKREVASAIIRRTIGLDSPPLTEEGLVFTAEAIFLELDQREFRVPSDYVC